MGVVKLFNTIVSSKIIKRSCFVLFILTTWNCINPYEPSSSKQVIRFVPPASLIVNEDSDLAVKVLKHNSTKLSKHKIDRNLNFTSLVIVSSLRSGSSFLGQLFNQNPSVFYFYEPLFPLRDACQMDQEEKVEILSMVLSCSLNASMNYIKKSIRNDMMSFKQSNRQNQQHLKRRLQNLKNCIKVSLCFPMSQCLHLKGCRGCLNKLQQHQVEKHCHYSGFKVVKTVRTCKLDWLERVQNRVKGQIMVVHLVRDPRAVALSRLEMHGFAGNTSKEMQINCKNDVSLLREHSAMRMSDDSAIGRNYMLVRYEDVLKNPSRFLDAVSKHTGKPELVHEDVLGWLAKNSRASTGSRYGTSRNTTEQIVKWRKSISIDVVLDVQRVCEEMMNVFGYRAFDSVADLRNLSLDSLMSST